MCFVPVISFSDIRLNWSCDGENSFQLNNDSYPETLFIDEGKRIKCNYY